MSLQQLAATLQQQLRAEASQQHRELGGVLLQAIDTLASMQNKTPEPLGSPLAAAAVAFTQTPTAAASMGTPPLPGRTPPRAPRAVLEAQRADLLVRLQAAQRAVAVERSLDRLAAVSREVQALTAAIMHADAQLQVCGPT